MKHKLLVVLLVAAASFFVLPLIGQDKSAPKKTASSDTLSPQSRAWILRGLTAEYAVARQTVPQGKEGLHLHDDGSIDERLQKIMLANGAPAVRTGQRTQITRVEFQKNSIVFEMNGGIRRQRHISVETAGPISGGVTQQQETVDPEEAQAARIGCYIFLDFGRPIPDLTVEDVKQMLGPVLDFDQRSAVVLASDAWAPEILEAVKKRTIIAGMSKDQVLASKGRPDNKIREKKGRVDQETWVYGSAPQKVLLVVFEQDEVVEAREYIPGIPATKVPRPGDPAEPDAPQPVSTKPEKP
jgi:hypothetical protein